MHITASVKGDSELKCPLSAVHVVSTFNNCHPVQVQVDYLYKHKLGSDSGFDSRRVMKMKMHSLAKTCLYGMRVMMVWCLTTLARTLRSKVSRSTGALQL